jgi:hypothetical protein
MSRRPSTVRCSIEVSGVAQPLEDLPGLDRQAPGGTPYPVVVVLAGDRLLDGEPPLDQVLSLGGLA